MRITIKLFGDLAWRQAARSREGYAAVLELPEGSGVVEAASRVGVARREMRLTMLNGQLVEPETASPLREGDVLAIFPPIH